MLTPVEIPHSVIGNIDTLLFSGGGVKAVAYCGALKGLESLGMTLSKMKRLGGCSAGGLSATFVALGYTPEESFRCLTRENLAGLFQPRVMDLIVNHYGLNGRTQLREFIRASIKEKTGNPDYTFKEMHDELGKDLSLFTCAVNARTLVELNYENSPDLAIAKALEMSMAMPVVFDPVEYEEDYYVDGGVMCNFPAEAYEKYKDTTLGIKLSADTAKPGKKSFPQYMMGVIQCALKHDDDADAVFIKYRYEINCGDLGFLQHVELADLRRLWVAGYLCTQKAFDSVSTNWFEPPVILTDTAEIACQTEAEPGKNEGKKE